MTLAEWLSASLAAAPPALLRGDDAGPTRLGSIPAAVLIAIVDRTEPTLLLTVRTDTLRHHAGQVAFPGGRADPGETAIDTALREANEEVGLDPARVDVIGCADAYRTITGFVVVPVVGIIPPDLPLVASDGEVADVFEVPLAYATNPINHAVRTMDWKGETRRYYDISWGKRRIWGATAAIIVNLARRLGPHEAGVRMTRPSP